MTLALAALATLGFTVQDVPGTIQGVVRDAAEGTPLGGVEVVLVGAGRSTFTDRRGRYLIDAVPGGDRRLRAVRTGFAPLEVDLSVPAAGVVGVDFHLRVVPFELPPVAATVDVPPAPPGPATTAAPGDVPAHAVIRVLDASPGVSELGIGTGARALLGPDPPAPDNVLYVRGAGASLDLILLDGAPVFAPFHLGGLVEPGLPPSIRRAQRLQGGVTARYDGGLADVLLLESKPGTVGTSGSAFVDMLAVGGAFAAGADDVGAVQASVRALHGSWETGLLNSGFPQRYLDALLRADLFPGGGSDTLSVTLFRNEESVRLDDAAAVHEPRWGNTAGSIRYHTPTALGRLELGGALGNFDTQLPVGSTDPLVATGETGRARAWADFRRPFGHTWVGYGVQGERLSLRTRFREPTDADGAARLRQRGDAGAIGVWVEGSRPVLRNVDVTAGLRGNFFTDDLGHSLSPRLHVGWQFADAFRLTGSYGRFHQLVVTVDTDLPIETPVSTAADGQVLGTIVSQVAAARSSHLVLGITHAPKPRSVARVELFWKTSGGVPEYGDGSLRNAGVDVLVSHPVAPNLDLWGAYTLAWAWADFSDAPTQSVYSGRHFLRGGVGYDAPGYLRLDADVSLGDGLEFGAIPRSERAALTPGDDEAAAPSAAAAIPASSAAAIAPVGTGGPGGGTLSSRGPLEDGGPIFTASPRGSYLRLNVQATMELEVTMFGRQQQLLPYFRIINALDRRDALFFEYESEAGDDPDPIGSVPILPVIGLEWRF